MKSRNCEKPSRHFNGRLTRFLIAVISPIALLMSSCCATKQIAHDNLREVRDSVIIREVREVTPVRIPESKVEMEIPLSSLRNLPEGASFTDKQGQAGVKVVYVPGETEYIIVTATCDSLQVLCKNLQRELTHIRAEVEVEKTEIKADNFKKGLYCGVIATGLAAILIAAVWAAIKRKFKLLKVITK